MSQSIFINKDSEDLRSARVKGVSDLRSQRFKQFVVGDSLDLDLFLVGTDGLDNIQSYAQVRAGLGDLDARPESGDYLVAESSTLSYDHTASELKAVIDSIVSEANVAKLTDFVFKIQFTANGSQTIPAIDSSGLQPRSSVGVTKTIVGDADTKETWLWRIFRDPVAIVSEFENISGSGIRGTLALTTPAIFDLIAQSEEVNTFFEVELTDSDGNIETVLQARVRLNGEVIGSSFADAPVTPTIPPSAFDFLASFPDPVVEGTLTISSVSPSVDVGESVARIQPIDDSIPLGYATNIHSTAKSQFVKSAKFTSYLPTAITGSVKTESGYCRILNFDGTRTGAFGGGDPNALISATGSNPYSSYQTTFPKFYQIESSDGSGIFDADSSITDFRFNNAGLTHLDLTGLSDLTYLAASSNKLTNFDATGLTNLEFINLTANMLVRFNGRDLSSATTLQLGGNALRTFVGAGMSSLVTLLLSANDLRTFVGEGMSSLVTLLLGNNVLTKFDGRGLNSVEILRAENNSLSTFSTEGLANIINLDLRNNPLTSFNSVGLTREGYELFLSNCNLSSLEINYESAHKVLLLDLISNSLSSLRLVNVQGYDLPLQFTRSIFRLNDNNLDADALNQIYTDLAPIADGVYENGYPNIVVTGNPGIGLHDPTIAEDKGYTVTA